MDSSPPKLENNYLYLLAFVIAASLRFIHLGTLPLTDPEADLALQALHVAQGARPLLGPQPGYVLLTSLLFFIFGSTNFLARFLPALAGTSMVFIPWFFRNRLKPQPALILAFALAIDPGLVAASRQAGGTILALTFILLAWAMWQDERPRWAGLFAGLALLSGTPVWIGLLGLGLAWAIRQGKERRPPVGNDTEAGPAPAPKWIASPKLKAALTSGLVSMLFIGTLFFLAPSGLSAWLASLPLFIQGWWTPSGTTIGRMLLALLTYQPLAVGLGLFCLVRGLRKGSRRVIRLSLWLLTSLLLALSYPAHQVTDMTWFLLPLWALAAIELARHLHLPLENRKEAVGVFVLALIILAFIWLDLAGLASIPIPSQQATVRLLLLVGSLLLLVVSIILAGMGWSRESAIAGGLWGTVAALTIYTLGVAWGATGLRTPAGFELWAPSARPDQAGLLLQTVNDLSDWSLGHVHAQPVTIVGLDSPALSWLLRGYEVEVANVIDPTSTPPLVITPPIDDLGLPAAYRGQDFVWRQSPAWQRIGPANFLSWLVLRVTPQDSENIILWARNDLFLDGRESVTP
jgi:hypothetical protein